MYYVIMTSFIVFGFNRPENQAQKPFKEGTRTRNKIFILFALIIILIIVSLAGFLFFKKSTNKDQSCQNFQDKKNSNPLNQSPPTGQTIAKKVDESYVSSLTKDDIKNLQLYSLMSVAPFLRTDQIDNIDNEDLVSLILNINTKAFIKKSLEKISSLPPKGLNYLISDLHEEMLMPVVKIVGKIPMDNIDISNLVKLSNAVELKKMDLSLEDEKNSTYEKRKDLIFQRLQGKAKSESILYEIIDKFPFDKESFIKKLDQTQIQFLEKDPSRIINAIPLMTHDQLRWINKGKKEFNSLIEAALSMHRLHSVFTRSFVEILSQGEVQSIDNNFVPLILKDFAFRGTSVPKINFVDKLSEDQKACLPKTSSGL